MAAETRLSPALWGVVAGVLGTGVGYLILSGWWCTVNGRSLAYFTEVVFLGSSLYKDSILTVSVLFNVAIFYASLRMEWYRFARGLMLVMILSVLAILGLQTQSFFAP